MLESVRRNSHDGVKSYSENFSESMALDISSQHFEQPQKHQADSKDQLSDEALMAAYAQGNVKAFEQLYARHKDALLRYFLRQLDSRAIAEELFQESWQSLIKNSANYKSSAKFSTYLYTIAHSRLVDFYRKAGKTQTDSMDLDENFTQYEAESDVEPEFQFSANELRAQLMDALDALPSEQKTVFLLKFEAGMSVPEIAQVLDQNPEAVKSRLRYCVANLKGFFSKSELMSASQ
ncbi:MAG: sigma-70 family RNA polymerase sigma factor [Gammaproteobacteria bacterium]|nr:sigma-70 family RNA polymerase sigma factor [Gammaproteobacteria bacterium]